MKFDHLNFTANAKTIEKLKHFYTEVFELEVGERPTFSKQGFWLYSGTQALLHLTVEDNKEEQQTSGNLDHVAFKLEHPDKFEQQLNRLSIPHRKQHITSIGCLQFFFTDPVGTGLEVNFDL